MRGCEQKYGVDFDETFSPVVDNSSLRILFALTVKKDYHLITFDIKTAFLHEELDENIYMDPPKGYNYSDKICKLQKALYGLKQAPLKWNQRFSCFLKQKGFEPLKTEQCIYVKKNKTIILGFYVDDGILLGENQTEMDQLIRELENEFEVTITRNPESFLGMEIKRSQNELKLTQKNYSRRILKKFKMCESRPVETPLVKGEDTFQTTDKNYPYREAIGSLLYLSSKTRPDLAQATNFCSRYITNPTNQRIIDVKRMFKYLNDTSSQGISFTNLESDKEILAYCDSDYAGDPETRKSTGYVVLFCGGSISWCSRKQPVVTVSSTEAEYTAAAECCKEIVYLKSLIEELTKEKLVANLKVDNQSAIKLIKNGVMNRRSKHIDVKYHFIHEKIKEKLINVDYCQSEKQLVDLFTKPLGKTKFNYHKNVLVN